MDKLEELLKSDASPEAIIEGFLSEAGGSHYAPTDEGDDKGEDDDEKDDDDDD